MSSGVKLNEELKELFNSMKVTKKGDDEAERIRLIVIFIGEEIEMEQVYRQKDLKDKDAYTFFHDLVLEKYEEKCRYFIYDCHFDTKESSKKEELIFVMWAPDGATVGERMLYSSSKSAMGPVKNGVKHSLQINEVGDFEKDTFLDTLGKDVKALEGCELHPAKGC